MAIDWTGVFPAMVTPFAGDGKLDTAQMRCVGRIGHPSEEVGSLSHALRVTQEPQAERPNNSANTIESVTCRRGVDIEEYLLRFLGNWEMACGVVAGTAFDQERLLLVADRLCSGTAGCKRTPGSGWWLSVAGRRVQATLPGN